MSESTTKSAATSTTTTSTSTTAGPAAVQPGIAELQAAADEATEKGYIGVAVDETPNEAYTLTGVGEAAENDEDA
jgi:hypothetical protein